MDAVNQWLDPTEVRKLAEQLLRPVDPVQIPEADAGFDTSFVGFMPQEADLAVEEKEETPSLVTLPAEAEPSMHEPVAEIPPVIEPPLHEPEADLPAVIEYPEQQSTSPSNRFLERINIFRGWLARNFQATDIFVLDHEGKVVFDESGHGRLHFMARNLALTSRSSGNIHVKIGPASILELIPCETANGRIYLGAIVPQALPLNHVQTITEALIQTASPA